MSIFPKSSRRTVSVAGVITEAERKAEQPAPVYVYYFTWKSPVHDGKLKAFHTLEIPFVLDNVDEAKSMTGSGADRYPLQEKMSGAWAAFARTGNPNHKGLPTGRLSRPISAPPWSSIINARW